jgi:hypothetical protein
LNEPIFQQKEPDNHRVAGEEPALAGPEGNWPLARGPVIQRRRQVHPLAWILLGAALNTLALGLLFWWLAGSSTGKVKPPPPNQLTNSDLSVRVTQDYVNREIKRAMQAAPLKIMGVAEVSDLTLEFDPGSRMKVNVRLTTAGRDFDFSFKDSLAAVNQKVVLTQVEDVRLEGLDLPLAALNEVVKQVNGLVENEINRQVGAGQPGDCLTCASLGRVPTLKSLTTEAGSLVAQFDIAIQN